MSFAAYLTHSWWSSVIALVQAAVPDDPDELMYEQKVAARDPAVANACIEEIEIRLRSLPTLTFLGWVIVVLLALILWRSW